METSKLRPCPFCGSSNIELRQHCALEDFYVMCRVCSAMGPDDDDKDIAIAKWAGKSHDLSRPPILGVEQERERWIKGITAKYNGSWRATIDVLVNNEPTIVNAIYATGNSKDEAIARRDIILDALRYWFDQSDTDSVDVLL